jgi:hypothetical protein
MRLADPDRMLYLISPEYVPLAISHVLVAAVLTAFSLSTGDVFHLLIAHSKLPVLLDRF